MVIYKISGPSGKVYIGSTANLLKRIREHKSSYKNGYSHPLYEDMRKHGFHQFKFEVIDFAKNRSLLFEKEQKIISGYQNKILYNVLDRPESFKKAHSLLSKKRSNTKKMSLMAKKNWEINRHHLIIKAIKRSHPDEMKKRAFCATFNHSFIKVSQRNDGKLIGIFCGQEWAAKSLNISSTSVHRYINKKRKHKTLDFELCHVCK